MDTTLTAERGQRIHTVTALSPDGRHCSPLAPDAARCHPDAAVTWQALEADMSHPEKEDFPWDIAVVDHPPRRDSALYTRSRKLMNKLAATLDTWAYGPGPYEDHHGGGLWVKDDTGWLCLQLPLGVEWSAQFCADPAKLDALRRVAARIIGAFPDTLPGYVELGYHDGEAILTTPITDAAGVAKWTDSIFNASVPLPTHTHVGALPTGAGYHHYPKPIVDIDHFRVDSFQLWVTDPDGLPAVVVPVAPPGSGDSRVRLLAVHPHSAYAARLIPAASSRSEEFAAAASRPAGPAAAAPEGDRSILDPDDVLSQQAYARQ
jgi:hypothetical protein